MRSVMFLAVVLHFLHPAWAEENEFVIGWTGPLTGSSAVVGVDSLAAVQLAVEEFNSAAQPGAIKIRLVYEDDGYVVTRALSAYHKLTSVDRAGVIFASTYGGVFAASQAALRDLVLIIDTLDCNDDIAALPANTLCLATQTESIAEVIAADIAASSHSDAVILLEESDGWMQFLERNIRELLTKERVNVVTESSLPTSNDYRSSLVRAKAASATALVILGNDQMGLALKQAADLAYNPQVYGIGSILSPGFQKLAQGKVEGAKVSSWSAAEGVRKQEFMQAFQKKFGRTPALELAAVPAYDAAKIVLGCVETASSKGRLPSDEDLRRCILDTKEYQGVSGPISFDPDGAVRTIREELYIVRNGVLTKRASS
ncbi:MAG: hypothetical protein DCC75_03495 [Proteobacteria bacterium]|nr:MAG: hypothetical protein DCC75_03495 [Pseudomonadota bacterium]